MLIVGFEIDKYWAKVKYVQIAISYEEICQT